MRTTMYLPDLFCAGMFNALWLIAIRVSLGGHIEGLFARSSHPHACNGGRWLVDIIPTKCNAAPFINPYKYHH